MGTEYAPESYAQLPLSFIFSLTPQLNGSISMIIPYSELSEQALHALIEDFVTRDGTDYGQVEMSMQDKAAQLLSLLKTDELVITYNEHTQT